MAHGFRLAAPVTRRRRPVFAHAHTQSGRSRGLGLTNRVSTEAREQESKCEQVREEEEESPGGRASASEDLGEQVQQR